MKFIKVAIAVFGFFCQSASGRVIEKDYSASFRPFIVLGPNPPHYKMTVKKTDLYASLWSSCDELRGSMDASQYKNYVLSLLFIKYISDKYAGIRFAPIKIPKGASFADMVTFKGKPDIGDRINKKIIGPLAKHNKNLSQADFFPDFNSENLGSDKEKVDRLTSLVAIFEKPALDFSKNHASDDDILGDAYEYLMRHFATESGKSKGQFYTPAEVSRVIAQVLEIKTAKTSGTTTVYDPTCGSGSLLLKVGDEAGTSVTLYGQEKDAATSGLAHMNMILHNNPTANISLGNTLTHPKYFDGKALKTFDYVVANPPFSDKGWRNGLNPSDDQFGRFESFGEPPGKQGDYAYLLHIIRSLKPVGRGACILPHGVLFRGNAEAGIRRNLIRKKYIKGIIGLPPNLFYGTGIPACIIVIDKKGARARGGIFMVDASQDFDKEGSKNRLRARDIHKIVDIFTKQLELLGYSRMVSHEEIEGNGFSLSLPRYIYSSKLGDKQDIEGHLKGGIPLADINALQSYWDICPSLKKSLFSSNRAGYVDLAIDKREVKSVIFKHSEFVAFGKEMNALFNEWRWRSATKLKSLKSGCNPKEVIHKLSESLLAHYADKPLIDKYSAYQHLMDYWSNVMQNDCYLISVGGWEVEIEHVIMKTKQGKDRDKGWVCDLVPKELVVSRYFPQEREAVNRLSENIGTISAKRAELEKEHGDEGGIFWEFEKVNKRSVEAYLYLKEIEDNKEVETEVKLLKNWLDLFKKETEAKKQHRDIKLDLDDKVYAKYLTLTKSEIKTLVVDDKWLGTIDKLIQGEMNQISHFLAERVRTLGERYERRLSDIVSTAKHLENKVNKHLKQMGFS